MLPLNKTLNKKSETKKVITVHPKMHLNVCANQMAIHLIAVKTPH